MGGRGIYLSEDNTQIKMADYIQSVEINSVKEKWDNYRAANCEGMGGNTGGQVLKKRCACCRQYTLPAFSEYEKCPVCDWIDDPAQNQDPSLQIGCNPTSLREAEYAVQGCASRPFELSDITA